MLLSVNLNTSSFVGQKFNRLLVLQPEPVVKQDGIKPTQLYKCLCDCGNLCFYPKTTILNGSAQSCKCLRLELTAKMGRNRKGKLKPRSDGLRTKKSVSGNTWQAKTSNRRSKDHFLSFADNLNKSNESTFNVFELESSLSHYADASRHIARLSKRKSLFLGCRFDHFVFLSAPYIVTSILIFRGDSRMYGTRYISRKKLQMEWPYGEVDKYRFSSVEIMVDYLRQLVAGIDLRLDFPRVKTVRLQVSP